MVTRYIELRRSLRRHGPRFWEKPRFEFEPTHTREKANPKVARSAAPRVSRGALRDRNNFRGIATVTHLATFFA